MDVFEHMHFLIIFLRLLYLFSSVFLLVFLVFWLFFFFACFPFHLFI